MRTVIIFLLITLSAPLFANIEAVRFDNAEMEKRYNKLIYELRCLVCQNQNIADSNAELAQDLRAQVLKMIRQGKSDEDIMDFMVTRYGDFVLYRPPFKLRTLLLWLGPFLFLSVGIWFLFRYIRRQGARTDNTLSEEEHQLASELLRDNGEDKPNE